ncbi:zinc-dependent peptidase [Labilibaculum sp. DW002]|uniref:Zinc-dependent peptidase n=1 Tax=Paralabilibaculum antarcticum TaxID=2912572 RepID=A0ABT5VTH7_9BACT|nr:zinc-dependent peptidase [Labilibaculum sp. DW002]MDE5417793.1 zinc-dependent peptidase [Labilibaculum sp. DW002]
MDIVILSAIVIAIVWFLFRRNNKKKWKTPKSPFQKEWRIILVEKVVFYNALSADEKKRFEFKIQEFLLNCRVTGVNINVDLTDRILVASSAIIPVFAFPEWKYTNLDEVLVYPGNFNEKFQTSTSDSNILGMVGSGYMEGKMILSKPALLHGFSNESDKKNTAVHEFVHLIDKMDGNIDGLPSILLEKQYAIPWFDLLDKKIDEIYEERSDINPYGGTNKAEFFAVASEYFFEKPKQFAETHPELYEIMTEVFNQNMKTRNLKKTKQSFGRNSPCPCGSGLKFKKCCGRVHYN